ncbi:hypothetical protein HPB51_023971 [Rhipicephalus microplus]|uniref:Secreted protein n=1 Tax=Rhipicephalus microplus TaxID=6941 RepID=A0A9J6EVB6_RHIMP|nr:hypothetical protein HPB51_023971 [Rhipicephalus microplus]
MEETTKGLRICLFALQLAVVTAGASVLRLPEDFPPMGGICEGAPAMDPRLLETTCVNLSEHMERHLEYHRCAAATRMLSSSEQYYRASSSTSSVGTETRWRKQRKAYAYVFSLCRSVAFPTYPLAASDQMIFSLSCFRALKQIAIVQFIFSAFCSWEVTSKEILVL